MSINPVLSRDSRGELLPLPKHGGESFLVSRKEIQFEAKLPGGRGKLSGKGVMYLTSHRLVMVVHSKKNRDDFCAFEVPLLQVRKYSFEQPIFGCNYLDVYVDMTPGEDDQIMGTCECKFAFYNGGAGTFLPVFFTVMKEAKNPDAMPHVISQIHQAIQGHQAYCDSNDPSTLYVVQPQMVPVIADPPPAPAGQQYGVPQYARLPNEEPYNQYVVHPAPVAAAQYNDTQQYGGNPTMAQAYPINNAQQHPRPGEPAIVLAGSPTPASQAPAQAEYGTRQRVGATGGRVNL